MTKQIQKYKTQEDEISAHFSEKQQKIIFTHTSPAWFNLQIGDKNYEDEASEMNIFEFEQSKNIPTNQLIERLEKIISDGYEATDFHWDARPDAGESINDMIDEIASEVGYFRDAN